MLKEILTGVLRPEHRAMGLSLEAGEDFVYLRKGGHTLALFSATGATIESILHEADQHLEWQRSGIEFQKVNQKREKGKGVTNRMKCGIDDWNVLTQSRTTACCQEEATMEVHDLSGRIIGKACPKHTKETELLIQAVNGWVAAIQELN